MKHAAETHDTPPTRATSGQRARAAARPSVSVVAAGALGLALAACGGTEEGGGTPLQAFQPNGPNGLGSGGDQPSGAADSSADSAGASAPGASLCQPGASRCGSAASVETCNEAGTGFDLTNCEGNSVCFGSFCATLSCPAGQTLCLGNEVHVCNADGESTTLSSVCGAGEICSAQTFSCQPRLCEPLLATCNGNVATRCNGLGDNFDASQNVDCGGLTCVAGNCVSPEGLGQVNGPFDPNDGAINPGPSQVAAACTPGEVTCNGNSLSTCNAEGSAFTAQPCGEGTCSAEQGRCLAPQICTPMATSCDGPSFSGSCSADGTQFDAQRCPDGTVCEGAGNCVPVSCNQQGLTSVNNGEATVYWFGQGTINFGDIACGYGIRPGNLGNGNGDAVNGIASPELFGAMNTANYQRASACGACVEMNYQGRSVTITIVDECPVASNPTCTAGHIDLSRGAWNQLTGNQPGTQIFGVNWRYVPCETNQNVTIELKEPDNAYWNEFLVRNHRYPIARAEVLRADGTWVEAPRTQYNYFHPPNDDMGTYRVRITDINGGVIEEQLELAPGGQGGNAQFACQ